MQALYYISTQGPNTSISVYSFVNDNDIIVLSFRRDVFPQGLPDEYAFVTTFKFRKTSRREDWYLWQVFDKYGIPQVGHVNNNKWYR